MIFYVKKSYGKNYKIINIYKIKTLKKSLKMLYLKIKKIFMVNIIMIIEQINLIIF
jgi:hypothetical protein